MEKDINRLKMIHAIIGDVLGKEYKMDSYEDPDTEIDYPTLTIENSGVLEEVTLFCSPDGFFINFWVCKTNFPDYDLWLTKYLSALIMLRSTTIKVLWDDSGAYYPMALDEAYHKLINIINERKDMVFSDDSI